MNVKVSKLQLVAAIQAKKVAESKAHDEATRKFAVDFGKYRMTMKAWLDKFSRAIDKAESGADLEQFQRYGDMKWPERPSKPSDPKLEKYDHALAKLALCVEDVIVLSDKSDGDFLGLI